MFLSAHTQEQNPAPGAKTKLRAFFIITGVVIVGGVAVLGASYVWFSDRAMPGAHIGRMSLSGLKQPEVENVLRQVEARLNQEGGYVTFEGSGEKKYLTLKREGGEGVSGAFATFNVQKEAEYIIQYGKNRGILRQAWAPFHALYAPKQFTLTTLVFDEPRLRETLQEKAGEFSNEYRDAELRISSLEPLAYTISPERTGLQFPLDTGVEQVWQAYQHGEVPQVLLVGVSAEPKITTQDIETFMPRLSTVVGEPLEFIFHTSSAAPTSTVSASPNMVAGWLQVVRDREDALVFRVKPEPTEQYIALAIGSAINKKPTPGEITRDDTGRVVTFVPAERGQEVDATSTVELVNLELVRRLLGGKAMPVSVPVISFDAPDIDPELVMLGIREVLGVGVSNFAGSPANRIKNIRTGAKKLNGLIIPPGAEFSTISSTLPYTDDGGYVPELVIKGSRLVPEIGGGLCQIGTTLFRMAMNGALEITERRNHSLAVSYYNDLGNGLPGTDATIYEPSPDFKFKNDTGHSVLIQTEVNTKTGDLVFTLWGTNDGRRGYYDPPKVLRWIPYGESVKIPSPEMGPGTENCQKAFRGAETTFTYYRFFGDGTEEKKEFASSYRALPQICLVGPSAEVSPETPSEETEFVFPSGEPIPAILP